MLSQRHRTMKLKKYLTLAVSLSALLLSSCNEIEYTETKDGYDVYRIFKGGNGVQRDAQDLNGTILSFDIMFDASAMYNGTTGYEVLNKALGFSDCGSDEYIDANSARFAWRWYNGKLELYSLTVVNNIADTVKLKNISAGQNYRCNIVIVDSTYRYSIDGTLSTVAKRGCFGTDDQRRLMYPYFGNDTIVAPKEIEILIKQNL